MGQNPVPTSNIATKSDPHPTVETRIVASRDLRPTELKLLVGIEAMQYGFFENIAIVEGQLVLDPWPASIITLKLDGDESPPSEVRPNDRRLKRGVPELFENIRKVRNGRIRRLVVRRGAPAVAELEVPGEFGPAEGV